MLVRESNFFKSFQYIRIYKQNTAPRETFFCVLKMNRSFGIVIRYLLNHKNIKYNEEHEKKTPCNLPAGRQTSLLKVFVVPLIFRKAFLQREGFFICIFIAVMQTGFALQQWFVFAQKIEMMYA